MNPARQLGGFNPGFWPAGLVLIAAIALLVYLGVRERIGFGPANVAAEWGGNPIGFTLLADRYVGPPLGLLVELAILVDLFAVALAGSNAFARGVFALARDGFLPRLLAARSRHETPLGGIVVNALFAVAGLVVATPLADRFDTIRVVAVTFTLIVMLIYLLLVWGAVRLGRDGRRPWHWPILALAAAVPALGIYGTLIPFPTGTARLGVWLTAAVLGVIALWTSYLVLRRPEAIDRAAAYALPPEDAVVGS